MRKRIVIAAIAIVVIGILAYVISPPKKGSVEYHKTEYLKTSVMPGNWLGVMPRLVQEAWLNRQADRQDFHHDALRESGYLTEREFAVSNASPEYVAGVVWRIVSRGLPFVLSDKNDHKFISIGYKVGTNVATVTGPAAMMDKVGELIVTTDVPQAP